jgi:hypothetical protein
LGGCLERRGCGAVLARPLDGGCHGPLSGFMLKAFAPTPSYNRPVAANGPGSPERLLSAGEYAVLGTESGSRHTAISSGMGVPKVSHVGPFFGFFDPDGRPWQLSGFIAIQMALESAFKFSFLTQRQLVIPAGYFLDNLVLQHVVLKYSGNDVESQCFRALMADCVSVSLNESASICAGNLIPWEETLHDWVGGKASNRGRFVYLNCLTHKHASELQLSRSEDVFLNGMSAGLSKYQVDLRNLLKALSNLECKATSQGPLPFEWELNEGLFRRGERFTGLKSVDLDRIQCYIELARRGAFAYRDHYYITPDSRLTWVCREKCSFPILNMRDLRIYLATTITLLSQEHWDSSQLCREWCRKST